MSFSPNKQVIVPENVLFRELEGESVILNLDSENYFGLDDIGTRMWSVLTQSESIQSACDTLLDEFDVSSEQLIKDINDLLVKLVNKGLVKVEDV